MKILVTGGAKNGKSTYAEDEARRMAGELGVPLYYIATMIPHDSEDEARIARHILSRAGKGFETVEQGRNILEILDEGKAENRGVFLLDSTTALLSNEMFRDDGTVDVDAGKRIEGELVEFSEKVGGIVFVSDYIYSDARKFDELTESYRRSLAGIDRALAKVCDRVVEVNFGIATDWK